MFSLLSFRLLIFLNQKSNSYPYFVYSTGCNFLFMQDRTCIKLYTIFMQHIDTNNYKTTFISDGTQNILHYIFCSNTLFYLRRQDSKMKSSFEEVKYQCDKCFQITPLSVLLPSKTDYSLERGIN